MSTDDFDAMMADLGLADATSPKPPQLMFECREDQFIHYISVKNPDKLRMLIHFLQHELSKYWFMVDTYTASIYMANVDEWMEDKDYAHAMIDYYLNMAHLTWFIAPKEKSSVGYSALPACDKIEVVRRILDLPDVKKILAHFRKN